jgi:hypothetical protein
MSDEARSYVWARSPYKGLTFIVHFAVADVVNDMHRNEFWMLSHNLADKVRAQPSSVRGALRQLVEDGFLEVLSEGGGRSPTRYRFLFPDVEVLWGQQQPSAEGTAGVVGTTAAVVGTTAAVVGTTAAVVGTTHNRKKKQNVEPNRKQNSSVVATVDDDATFDAFWEAYGRKVGKKAACGQWDRHVRGKVDPEMVIAAAAAYAAVTPVKYRKHPERWLRDHRWADEDCGTGTAGHRDQWAVWDRIQDEVDGVTRPPATLRLIEGSGDDER